MTTGKVFASTEVMDETGDAFLPAFVAELSKPQQGRWQRVKENYLRFKAATDEHGMLVPASLAAKLADVSRQRIAQLREAGKLQCVDLDGHIYVTERSLLEWMNAPTDRGGRPRKPTMLELWSISQSWAKEHVQGSKKSS